MTTSEMTAKDLDETLATIAKRAKDLRDAGVFGRVTIGDVEFEIAGPEPELPMVIQQAGPENSSPLDDADTFGADDVPRRRKPLSHDEARSEFEKE